MIDLQRGDAPRIYAARGIEDAKAREAPRVDFWPSCSRTSTVPGSACFVHKPILPLPLTFHALRCVQRSVAGERRFCPPRPAPHAETGRDLGHLIGAQVTLFHAEMRPLACAGLKNSFFWLAVGAHLHERPRTQDVFLNGDLDPPHGIWGQRKPLSGRNASQPAFSRHLPSDTTPAIGRP